MSISAATIITTTRAVVKYGGQVIEYIRNDQNAKLGLLVTVRIVIEGPGVGIGSYSSPDGLFKMLATSINRIEFNILPFPPDAKSWWNGPDRHP